MEDDSDGESDESRSTASLSSTDSELESVETDEELPVVEDHADNPDRLLKIVDRWNAPFANAQFIEPRFHERSQFDVQRDDDFHLNPETAYFKREDLVVLPDENADTVEYEVDHEDLIFLNKFNKCRAEDGPKFLTDRKFEQIMDALEKACHFQCTDQDKQFDQASGCCICREGEADQSNQILFCDMCNIAVHQDCYGVPYVPEGQWFCRRCQISPSVAVNCVACFQSTGALKRTTCGRWAHVVCTIWVNELHFGNTAFMEPIENVDFALKRRRKLRCIVCKRRGGACLQCSKKHCSFAFHVTCAITAGFEMRVNETGEGSVEANVYSHFIFCPMHSYCKGAHGNKKRKARAMVNVDEKILNEKAVTSIPVITPEKIEELRNALQIDNMEQIVGYWFQKRKAHGGIPMIRRLQVGMTGCRFDESSVEDIPKEKLSKPLLEAEPRPGPSGLNLSSSDYSSPPVLVREDSPLSAEDFKPMHTLKTMLSMVLRREKLKRTRINLRRELFEESTSALHAILLETLDLLAEKDPSAIFAEPVKEEEVPGYHRIIKHPMDLSKMRKKVEDEAYRSLGDFKSDFILMMDNCKAFNKENAYFLEYGSKFRSAGLKIFRQQERRLEDQSKVISEVLQSLKHLNTKKEPKIEINLEDPVLIEEHVEETEEETCPDKSMPFMRQDFTNTSFPKARECTPMSPLLQREGHNDNRIVFRSQSLDSDNSGSDDENREDIDDSWNAPEPIEIDESLIDSEDQFLHDDIVWVDGYSTPGRVVDPRMKALFTADISFTAIMQDKPKDSVSNEYCLVFFFDKHKSWGWFPAADLSHCDVMKEAENSRSDMAIECARRYWESAQL
ncbi:hypothetical protein QR680_006008 [Steinernema hermaphroditum]|uniref:Uncharacterized protein n=1 Tax=Steinernema hermaphroditum TaxID=289476 RepID=A0AA39LVT8_9BILA|nr:hypothetical protein QR680_006008 [Steinernema hermaphroditum]